MPGQCGSVVEHQSVNQKVMVLFPVRAHAQIAGWIPAGAMWEAAAR